MLLALEVDVEWLVVEFAEPVALGLQLGIVATVVGISTRPTVTVTAPMVTMLVEVLTGRETVVVGLTPRHLQTSATPSPSSKARKSAGSMTCSTTFRSPLSCSCAAR